MIKFFIYIFNLFIRCENIQIFERSAGLTLRVLLAFFPFLVFLMALMGFLELDVEAILVGLYSVLPSEISDLVASFVTELAETRSAGLLSAALFFSVYNTSNGFRAIIRITNSSYGVQEHRGFVAEFCLSYVLMLLFSTALIIMLALLVFGHQIWRIIFPHGSEFLFAAISGFSALVSLFFFTALIYKFANRKPLPLKHILPGAAITVTLWLAASFVFGIFTRDFSQLPMIYGSIANVFILILWLNAVSTILLIGNEVNALLHEFSGGSASTKFP